MERWTNWSIVFCIKSKYFYWVSCESQLTRGHVWKCDKQKYLSNNGSVITLNNISRLWRFYLCHGNFVILFFSEFPLRGISCLIETSQLILACEFAFALPNFWLAEFSDQIKNDFFAVFHHGLEISKVFFTLIPIKKLIFLD